MRIPHYLVRSDSGVYHFRLKVPADAQAALGVRVLKQSLRTRDSRIAQIHSSLLYLRYASAIVAARGGDVMPKPHSVETYWPRSSRAASAPSSWSWIPRPGCRLASRPTARPERCRASKRTTCCHPARGIHRDALAPPASITSMRHSTPILIFFTRGKNPHARPHRPGREVPLTS